MDRRVLEEGLAVVAEARAGLVGVVVADDDEESVGLSSDSGAADDGDIEEFLRGAVRAVVQRQDSTSSESDASTATPDEEELSDLEFDPSDYLVSQHSRKNLRGARSEDGMRVRKEPTLSQKQWICRVFRKLSKLTDMSSRDHFAILKAYVLDKLNVIVHTRQQIIQWTPGKAGKKRRRSKRKTSNAHALKQ